MSEDKTYTYESDISSFLIIVLLFIGGYFVMTKTLKIHPYTKELNPGAYGRQCGKIIGICKDIAAISCNANRGGPLYYVNKKSGAILGRCGGDCLNGICDPQTCPPLEWNCAKVTY